MTPATAMYIAWALSFYLALASLLAWKHRRTKAQRRISRGLRMYTTDSQMSIAVQS